MLLAEIVATSDAVAATRSRRAKTALLADCLRRMPRPLVAVGAAWLTGLLPQGRIGIGQAQLVELRAIPPVTSAGLNVAAVDEALTRVRDIRGAGAVAARRAELAALFAAATSAEQSFLVRLLTGELRQGALAGLMLEAIAEAAGLPPAEVRRAAMFEGDLARVAEVAVGEGSAGLAQFRLELLKPMRPMLAQPAEDLEEALAELGSAAIEYKLDGARVQVHKRDDEVRVYTRALNDVTAAVPEIVAMIRALPARTLVLDGETLALRADGTPQPFQVTMRRFGRRLEVERMRAELPLSAFYFDCLHLDGRDLAHEPLTERLIALDHAVPQALTVPRLVIDNADAASNFMNEALARGHEGVMLKSLAGVYEAGSRGASWRKLKQAHTLDLVVLAAEWGSGRRRGYLSNLHLGAREGDGFVMLGKTFKGMTDAMLAWQTEHLRTLAVATEGHVVHVRLELVVEIAFNDLQESPQYPGGLALRFARVKRYREDKRAAEADDMDTVRALYRMQGARGDERDSAGSVFLERRHT